MGVTSCCALLRSIVSKFVSTLVHHIDEGRTPVLKDDEAGGLCVDEAVSGLLFALAAANLSAVRRLSQQIAESDYEPPVRPKRTENRLDGSAVVRFVQEQGRRVSRQEIEHELGLQASTRCWSRLMQRLTRAGLLQADGYGTGRRYWVL